MDQFNNLRDQNLTYFHHNKGFDIEDFTENEKLMDFFDILGVNYDDTGRWFISTIEAKDYPIYGTQYHPEKNIFEWNIDANHAIFS